AAAAWSCISNGAAPQGIACTTTASLAAGASSVFTFTTDALPPSTGGQTLTNSASVSPDPAVVDPGGANNTATDDTDVTAQADLSIAKTDGVGSADIGDALTYTLTVNNAGPNASGTGVAVSDTLPAAVTVNGGAAGPVALAGADAAAWSCISNGAAPQGIACTTTASLAAGASSVFAFTTDALPPSTGGQTLTNSVSVSPDPAVVDPDGANNTATDDTDVTPLGPVADLAIDKSDNGVAQAGAYLTYSLVVTNNGPDAADSVTVTDALDANTTFVTSMAACVEAPTGTLTCLLGTLASGASISFDVVVWVDPAAPTAGSATGAVCGAGEDLCNLASVDSATPDPVAANDTVELASDVIPATTFSAVSVSVTDLGTEPFVPGTDVTYEITVTNPGPDDALETVVYNPLGLNLSYVSDTGGCAVQTGNDGLDRLACPIGTLPAFSTVTFQVTATIALAAPIQFTAEDGDCAGVEDLCDTALVVSRSADGDPGDNFDSEPTNASANLNCGDGIVDPGEECEPPDTETCNNGVDDDANGLVDCADPGCAVPGFESCDANCLLTPECLPILNDPAVIRSFDTEARSRGRRDYVKIHGRFIPETPADPVIEGFAFSIGNADGEFYRGRLLPLDLEVRAAGSEVRWIYKDNTAKLGPGLRQGLSRVSVRAKLMDGYLNYSFKIVAYGDLSRANRSRMTTQVYIGDDVAYLTADWSGGPGRWRLSLPQDQ
ncbi:MAG: DUF11 domain-containing protein, partial [Deltaproteobacteria bacterium]|nr:DUF11 domain-containing protein [Deltaproteobacteria bacterium]